MKIEQVHPYFNEARDELIEQLLSVPERRFDAKPAHMDAMSIRQIVLHVIDEERYLIVHIAQQCPWDRVASADFRTRGQMVEGLRAARAATRRYVESLEPISLKIVRTIPADPTANQPDLNQPISWILWQVMRNDIYYLGQFMLRCTD
jgi:hypothetical protein